MIAIVDDDESVRVATRSLVRSLGFDALTFASAEDFLQSAKARESDCVIADVQMPGLSGIDLQRRLLADGWGVPIIFITAFPNEAVEERAIGAGAIGYLSKPFEVPTLIECLNKALRQDNPNASAN